MPARLSTKQWIAKAEAIHGDQYDYSKVNYKNSTTPVTVVCKLHGPWLCNASNHINKNHPKGCPTCGGSKPKTTTDFVRDARVVHGNLFDYSQVKYVNSHTNVIVICKTHGPFKQTPTSHLSGAGCPLCATAANFDRVREESLVSVKERLFAKTGGDVSIVEESFTNINAEADFMCKVHGAFRRVVNSALYRPNACIHCFLESDQANRLDQEMAEKRLFAMLLDGDVTAEPFEFRGRNDTTIVLSCPKHGKWSATWSVATKNNGRCPMCAYEASIPKRTASVNKHHEGTRDIRWASYLAQFKELHSDKYDYSKAEFVDAKTSIEIVCPIHGSFMQKPDAHASGGCRLCADEELSGLYNERYFELKPEMTTFPATLYLLKLNLGDITCFKVGITRTTLKRRFGAALGKGVRIEVIAVRDAPLIEVWRDEVRLLALDEFETIEFENKAFARDARISPTELRANLPDNWRDLANWTSTERYWL